MIVLLGSMEETLIFVSCFQGHEMPPLIILFWTRRDPRTCATTQGTPGREEKENERKKKMLKMLKNYKIDYKEKEERERTVEKLTD